jgi:hypothetical protein
VSDSRGQLARLFAFWENRLSAFEFILPIGLVEADRKNCKDFGKRDGLNSLVISKFGHFKISKMK